MDRDKQIEFERNEMAEVIADSFDHNGEKWDASDFEWSAYQVQQAGYRRASEVAREIFEEIEKVFTVKYPMCTNPVLVLDSLSYAELKKKYTESGE